MGWKRERQLWVRAEEAWVLRVRHPSCHTACCRMAGRLWQCRSAPELPCCKALPTSEAVISENILSVAYSRGSEVKVVPFLTWARGDTAPTDELWV